MQAIERATTSADWITVIILLSFFILVLLKFLDKNRLKGCFLFYLNKGYVETESFENPSFFSLFNIVFSVFSSMSFSLLILWVFDFFECTFLNFIILFSVLFLMQLFQNFMQILLTQLFSLKNQVITTLLISQRSSLFSVSIFVFVTNVLFFYSGLKSEYIIYTNVFIFTALLWVFLNTNKKLIISKLFYFILYLCAFKLAPLLVLFKLIL
ncbi:MAG: DUF4271 domain-containing protein [Flavobacteriaceae bacterium]